MKDNLYDKEWLLSHAESAVLHYTSCKKLIDGKVEFIIEIGNIASLPQGMLLQTPCLTLFHMLDIF